MQTDCKQCCNSNDATNVSHGGLRGAERKERKTQEEISLCVGEGVHTVLSRTRMPEGLAGGAGDGEKRGAVAANGHPRGHARSRRGSLVSVSRRRPKVVRNRKPMGTGREKGTHAVKTGEKRVGR